MKKKNATKWVKALRSGKFKQGCGWLVHDYCGANERRHCCLGVLAEINGFNGNNGLFGCETLEGIENECDLFTEDGTPLIGDKDEANMVKVVLRTRTKKSERVTIRKFANLADANDKGASFKTIATWIEKNYKLL